MPDELTHQLEESVNEGVYRLRRDLPGLLSTGFVGGLDVSVGVYGALLVLSNDGSDLLAAFVFSFGFIALVMAGSELFTENFLMPVTALATGKGTWGEVLRLWGGTLLTNILGGAVMVFIMLTAFPDLGPAAVEKGSKFIETGPGLELALSATLAGIIITLMTWMQVRESVGVKIVAAVGAAFLLHYGGLGHVVVASIEIFAAWSSGADFSLLEWVPLFVIMAVFNMVGGIGLVTVVRLVQVGTDRVRDQQERPVAAEDELRPAERKAERLAERAGED